MALPEREQALDLNEFRNLIKETASAVEAGGRS